MPSLSTERRKPPLGLRIKTAALLLAVIGAIGAAGPFRIFRAPPPALQLEVRDDVRVLEQLSDWPSEHGSFENRGFLPCRSGAYTDSGWCLPPGAQGSLRYILTAPEGSRSLLVRTTFIRRHPEAANRLLIWRDGEPEPRLSFSNVYFADERLDLSSLLDGASRRIVLQFEGDNRSAQPDVTLQAIEARIFREPLPPAPSLPVMTLAFLALGLAWLPLVSWRRLAPFWLILTAGFALRYLVLRQYLHYPLDHDAVGFYGLANSMHLFTSTGFYSAAFGPREPFFLLIVKAFLGVLGDSETSIRLVSFFCSILALALMYRLGSRVFNRWLGLAGMLCMAVSLPLIMESPRGLRLEVELVLVLLLFEVMLFAPIRSAWLRAGVTGVLVGLLALTRFTYGASLCALLLFMALVRKPRQLLPALLAIGIAVGLQVPHRLAMARLHGDPFYDMAYYARWHANFEFIGKPGYAANPLEMWKTVGGGEATMSYGDYLLKQHTPAQLAQGTLRGTWKAIRHLQLIGFPRGVQRLIGVDLRAVDIAFQALGVIGLVIAAATPGLQWIPAAWVLFIVPIAFQYDLGVLERWRQILHAMPLFICGVLLALSKLPALARAVAPGASRQAECS